MGTFVQVTGETIKSAIAQRIAADFTTPRIKKERLIQGSVKPEFFIKTLEVEQTHIRGEFYNRVYQMLVEYDTTTNNLTLLEDLETAGSALLESLMKINVPIFSGVYDGFGNQLPEDKQVSGTQMSYKITEGVMQVFATYTLRLRLHEEQTTLIGEVEAINTSLVYE